MKDGEARKEGAGLGAVAGPGEGAAEACASGSGESEELPSLPPPVATAGGRAAAGVSPFSAGGIGSGSMRVGRPSGLGEYLSDDPRGERMALPETARTHGSWGMEWESTSLPLAPRIEPVGL